MEFDRLCKEVERRYPQHRKMLEDARMFLIDDEGRAAAGQEKTNHLETWHPDEQVQENFRLPFDCIAIDWGDTCVAIKTLDAGARRYLIIGTRTSGQATHFFRATVKAFPGDFVRDASRLGRIIECIDFEIFRDGESVDFSMEEMALHSGKRRTFRSSAGAVATEESPRGYTGPSGFRMKLHGEYVDMANPDPKQYQELKAFGNELSWCLDGLVANMLYLELNTAILFVLVICEPSRFVVEESLAAQHPYVGKLIRRSANRPHYIALRPGEIKRRFLYDEHDPTEIPRSPHERRGHYRLLKSERYVSKRNHVIWIKPCWVGKTEGIKGKNRYRVMLDL